MIKSFNQWLEQSKGKQNKTVQQAIDSTALQTVKSLTAENSKNNISKITSQLTTQFKEVAQACKQGNTKACAKLDDFRNAEVKLATIQGEKRALEYDTENFFREYDVKYLNLTRNVNVAVKSFSNFKKSK